jgi:hypothetical protein
MDDDYGADYRPEEATGAAINIGQVVQGSMVVLLGDMASIDAAVKFRTLTTSDFQVFYQKFCHTFLMAEGFLDPGTIQPIQAFLSAPINLEQKNGWTDAADQALLLARAMKKDLETKGLWSVFSPTGEPPFMMDVIY